MESLEEINKGASTPITYVPWDELINHHEGKTTAEIVTHLWDLLKDKNDWRNQFEFLDSLRSVNKFQGTATINQVVPPFCSILKDCAESIRSNISKNTLLFFGELFKGLQLDVPLRDEILSAVIPKLIEKSIADKAFLKTEAKASLKNLEAIHSKTDVIANTTLVLICKQFNNKNASLVEVASTVGANIITEHLGGNFLKVTSHETQVFVLKSLARLIENKRAVLLRNVENICATLQKFLSNEKFEGYITEVAGGEDGKIIITHLNSKVKKSGPSESLHAFLAKKKGLSENNNINNNQC